MNDLLPIFDDGPSQPESAPLTQALSESQRDALRKSFAQLGILDARGQFAMVEELTGERITSVQELAAHHAQALIHRLDDRVASIGRRSTGNAWADREEDTWIDKL
ncbi:hypothetical protein E3N86_00030 [Cryobacterium sp. Hz7]|uniref:hypothetical protein n=1 Tax=Cryobacterium sp. Hz7 TaxID=1259166 RepID=UPI00106B654C|nr:hypothetical protein [Cryobacterium sp. Hz7]TFB67197.1 hypothetical protein E3N86_00030 [Cryobacterium sp. Hz7]